MRCRVRSGGLGEVYKRQVLRRPPAVPPPGSAKGVLREARVLTEDSKLKIDGLAYLINDNLYNSYQKVMKRKRKSSSSPLA